VKLNLRGIVDARDAHLYGGLVALAAGVALWRGVGPGVALAGAVLLLIGVFGIPDWRKRGERNGSE
jgi:hypothetical protein